jgi:site-specific DNA-methyltransferase (adenine-specific)
MRLMERQHQGLSNAERQAAWRLKQAAERLSLLPQVHTEHYSLYQGDALQIVPLLSGYDHCITDPPYEAEAHTRTRRTRAVLEGRAPSADIAFAPITEPQRRFLTRLRCQWLLVFCQAEAVGQYEALLGTKYKRGVVWWKRDGAPQFTGDRPAMGYESIICAWCQAGRSDWNAGGKRGVYEHLVRDGEPRLHPTQKPLGLMKDLLRDFTQHHDVVLDPFMGSATTGVACLELGRRFVGIELDPGAFQIACQRLAQASAQGRLFARPRPATQAPLL